MATNGATSTLMTTEQFLAIADGDGVTRELIEGRLRETDVTTRSPKHSLAIAHLSHVLANWLDQQTGIEGDVTAGEVRCRLQQDPPVIVGIDVALFTGEVANASAEGAPFYDGAPLLAVEVLSPSDTHETIADKTRRYLAAGAKQVWIADPDFQTVTVHRPDQPPRLYSVDQTLEGGEGLPGFSARVGDLFGRKRGI